MGSVSSQLNCTRLLFPANMTADAIGVSTTNVDFWLTPWRRVDEHLPLSHIAEVTHVRGFFWDAISVESSGGLNPSPCVRRAETRCALFRRSRAGAAQRDPARRAGAAGAAVTSRPLPSRGQGKFGSGEKQQSTFARL